MYFLRSLRSNGNRFVARIAEIARIAVRFLRFFAIIWKPDFKNQRGLIQHLRCCRRDKQGDISNLNSNKNANFQGSLFSSSSSDYVQVLTVNSNDLANVQPSTKRSNGACDEPPFMLLKFETAEKTTAVTEIRNLMNTRIEIH